jgi:putative membrane protein
LGVGRLEINIVFFLAGIFLGFLSGFVPGIHSNTIIAILASLGFYSDDFACLIIGLFPAHLVAAFIPSIFFGIPEQGSVIAVLPGQRLVLDGQGIVALKSVLVGVTFSALIAVVLFGPSIEIYKFLYSVLSAHLAWIVFGILFILLIRSKNPLLSLLIMILSGAIGVFSFGSDMSDKFLPMFSGMFAIGAILNYSKRDIPKQVDGPISKEILKYSALGVVLGMFADLLPGVSSPSQVAVFATLMMPLKTIGFLVMIASIAISEGIFSLSTAASIGKSRMGATATLSDLVNIDNNLASLLILALVSISIVVSMIYFFRKKRFFKSKHNPCYISSCNCCCA